VFDKALLQAKHPGLRVAKTLDLAIPLAEEIASERDQGRSGHPK
jgi:hypothetical protein